MSWSPALKTKSLVALTTKSLVALTTPKSLVDSPGTFQIEHLYGLTVFENYLYATNSDNANAQQKTSVIRVNRFNSTEYQVVTRHVQPGAPKH
ncbi:hypothetical protein DV515_00016054 [Chloebia gouldiae]|uniref:Uncharacterized protein n=1 Tax=Chloebia gouldiae TaxID=44316 RepID=A0A3L8RU33_CHLGU|nr:hypothetical protein DV515_00016054 [Chloebia gouldiae]